MRRIFISQALFFIILMQTHAQSAFFTSDSPRCVNDTMHFTPGSPGGVIIQESWDFGDGVVAIFLPPVIFPVFATHVYASPGIFTVSRTVKFSTGNAQYSMQVQLMPLPVANFSYTDACEGSPTLFTDLSFSSGGAIVSFSWNFGDGGTSSLSSPAHTYASYGIYNVTLTVVNSNGCTHSVTKPVTVNPRPVAAFSFPATNCTSSTVAFTDLSYIAAGFSSYIIQWVWDFGDGTPVLSISFPNNPNVMHTFIGSATAHIVRLTVTASNGCTAFKEMTVTSTPAPVANFTADTVLQGTSTTFTDLSYSGSGSIVSRLWEFGDGLTATTINPTHVYGASGIFMAKLTVTDNNGCAKDTTKPVVVLFNPLIGPPATRTVTNVIVASGETKCYNASQVITVAGNGTLFFVLSGGSATFIAGQKISLLPSTTIQPEGYMHGYIAPTGPWCVTPSMPAVSVSSIAVHADEMPGIKEATSFKIYPNPTNCEFTLELQGEIPTGNVSAELYGILGEKMKTVSLSGINRYEFSLSGKPAGVYFIRIISGNKSEIVKVLKN